MLRTCKKCRIEKSLDNFHQSKVFNANDYICHDCKTITKRIRNKDYHLKRESYFLALSCRVQKNQRKQLKDAYIVACLKKEMNSTSQYIYNNPDLIELKRAYMKLNRLIKELKN